MGIGNNGGDTSCFRLNLCALVEFDALFNVSFLSFISSLAYSEPLTVPPSSAVMSVASEPLVPKLKIGLSL